MREIKFRCYLKDSALEGLNKAHFERPEIGRMFDVEAIEFPQSEVVVYTPSELEFAFNDIELMQFTGLHDKNGREIYEGDILVWGWQNSEKGKVIWEDYGWCVEYKHGRMYFQHPDSYEVIGNIYEHPKLLEATNEE